MRRAPAHAGRLKPWERLAFALAFALMAAFAAVVTVSTVRAREHGARPAAPAATSQSHQARGDTPPGNPANGSGATPGTAPGEPAGPPAVTMDQQLASALAPVLLHHTGNLAVGVIDRTTGARAVYGGGRRFAAAGLISSDILAVLLLRNQQAGTVFGESELQLAAQMMETSDASAATVLWQAAGAAGGVAAADTALGLRHTTPGQGLHWALASTTARDQLRLLADLTSPRSPLTAASRSYELSLMRRVRAGQAWGIPVAATAGSSYAVCNGSLADPRLWAVSSIGVIRHAGQELLVAVLSDGQPTKSAGIAQDEAAAVAAVRQITARRS